jgi:F-type H+-transporting ATPase subunit epsilon
MSMTMHIDIVSLEKQIFSGRAIALFVTGSMGELGIYPGHAQLLSSLKPGQIRIQLPDNGEELYYVSGGLIEVQPETTTILADTVVRATDIDEAAAIEAKERAEKVLSGKRTDFEYSRATAELAEAIAQIRAIQQLKKKYKV